MPAIFEWTETNGTPPGTTTLALANVNFGSIDGPNLASPNNRVIAGQNSFEKWLRGRFSGTFTTIDNLRFYKSAGTLPANAFIKAAVNAAYAAPSKVASAVALMDVPTIEAGALAPAPPGPSPSFSGYITLQMQTTSAAASGAVPTQTFTLKYDEI